MENKELKRTVGFYIRDEQEKRITKSAIQFFRSSEVNKKILSDLLEKEGLNKDQLV